MSLAGRPSVRVHAVDSERGWVLADNPSTPKVHGELVPACHDRSPFVTIECGCGEPLHLHETQIAGMPRDAELATRCKSAACGEILLLDGGYLLDAFVQVKQAMRSNR